MRKFLFILFLICPLFGLSQATSGWHRVNQLIARGSSGVEAVVVPYATVSVTGTTTGLQATIYSDPLLTAPIIPSVVSTDDNGNYDYYLPINYCVTETISSPSQGTYSVQNVCGNTSPSGTINQGNSGQVAYYPNTGVAVSGENFASVSQGGTGRQNSVAYGLLAGGTTSTGAQQSVSTGTSGQPLVSGGSSSLPSFSVLGLSGGGTNAISASGAWTNIFAGIGTETANQFLGGPSSGSPATASFRVLASNDIPNNAANTTGQSNTALALAASPTQCSGSQYATGVSANGNANCGTPTGTFVAGGDLSGSLTSQQVKGLSGVPFCSGFSPTNGQSIQYTTGGSPNPCYGAVSLPTDYYFSFSGASMAVAGNSFNTHATENFASVFPVVPTQSDTNYYITCDLVTGENWGSSFNVNTLGTTSFDYVENVDRYNSITATVTPTVWCHLHHN